MLVLGRDTLSVDQAFRSDHILALIQEWMELMHLGRWELTVTFVPTLKDGETEDDACRTWADTYTSWFYQTIHVTIYSRMFDPIRASDELVEHVVVHELSHSLVKPMEAKNPSDREDERTEFVVTNLERILFGLKYRQKELS